MNNTCWESITEKEFKYWLTEVGKTHHIFDLVNSLTKEKSYFIEDEGLNRIFILSVVDSYKKKLYYKNSNVIGS